MYLLSLGCVVQLSASDQMLRHNPHLFVPFAISTWNFGQVNVRPNILCSHRREIGFSSLVSLSGLLFDYGFLYISQCPFSVSSDTVLTKQQEKDG